jgi:adenosylcobyric acid synthase
VFGICGGYQMLGRTIDDPQGIEGPPGRAEGLGLIDVDTVLTGEKRLAQISGDTIENDVSFHGYEMHVGITTGPDTQRPVLRFADGRVDGASSADGRVTGAYVHGLFADDRQRRALVARLGATPSDFAYDAVIDQTLDALANHLGANVDLDRLLSLAR